jgi:hypothetical protein
MHSERHPTIINADGDDGDEEEKESNRSGGDIYKRINHIIVHPIIGKTSNDKM